MRLKWVGISAGLVALCVGSLVLLLTWHAPNRGYQFYPLTTPIDPDQPFVITYREVRPSGAEKRYTLTRGERETFVTLHRTVEDQHPETRSRTRESVTFGLSPAEVPLVLRMIEANGVLRLPTNVGRDTHGTLAETELSLTITQLGTKTVNRPSTFVEAEFKQFTTEFTGLLDRHGRSAMWQRVDE